MTPVMHDSDEWRELIQTVVTLKLKAESLEKTVDKLVAVMWEGDGPEKPSIVTEMRQNTMELRRMNERFSAKNIVAILTIIILLATILGIFGPTIRHAMSLSAARMPAQSKTQNAVAPNLGSTLVRR